MRNGRKGDIRTCLFVWCGGWAAFLYDRTVPKIGIMFLQGDIIDGSRTVIVNYSYKKEMELHMNYPIIFSRLMM